MIAVPFRDETQSVIGERALGPNGKYAGPTALTTLQRYHLAKADVNPADRRRRLYRGIGKFDDIDWTQYYAEKADAFSRFGQLCELGQLPACDIPGEIDRYFGDVPADAPPPAGDALHTTERKSS